MKIGGKCYDLTSRIVYVVGSCDASDGCEIDITVEGSTVDHKHAAIDLRSGVVKVHDLMSQFGTFVADDELDQLGSTEVTKSSAIKFGAVVGELTLFTKVSGGKL